MVAWATILLSKADAAVVQHPASSAGMLMLLGLALVGLGVWGRTKFHRGTTFTGSYLSLGVRKVNYRGTSFFHEQEESGKKMKRLIIILTVLFVFTISAYAEMSALQGNGMMRNGWWWGVNFGWFFMIISAALIIFGVFLIMKRN